MNISSVFGLLCGSAVLYLAMSGAVANLEFFLQPDGILIVMGGTAAAASICFPINKVLLLVKVFLQRVVAGQRTNYQDVITQLMELNKRAGLGIAGLKDVITTIRHPFLKEAVELVSAGVLTEAEIRQTLEQRVKTTEARYYHEANMFRVIGRFPPAFGLLATTLGMIGLLQKIGQPESQKLIGPAMSVGLVGTLYGIALANLVFLPIAENLSERTAEEITLRKLIVEGACMLKAQVNPITMREGLNSFLVPADRVVRQQKAA